MSETVHSYGTIPVHYTPNSIKFLIIHMYGSAGGTHWSFPKGRPEPNETPLESALRETKEEVGLRPQKVFAEHPFTQQYEFQKDDVIIKKLVTYYIAVVDDTQFQLQEEEVKEAQWCDYETARELITHENGKQLLDQVRLFLETEDK